MPGLLAPVLAQLVTLGVADRLEGHYVASDQSGYFDSSNTTTPGVTLALDDRRGSFTLAYSPSFLVVPLEENKRELFVDQRGFVDATYRWRRTTFSVDESAMYGERDFALEAVGLGGVVPTVQSATPQQQPTTQPTNPNAPTGQPPANGMPAAAGTGTTPTTTTPGTTNNPATGNLATPALQNRVLFGAFRTSATLSHLVSRAISWRLLAGYSITGGMDRPARVQYPLVRGPDATGSLRYALDGRDALTTTLTGQLLESGLDNALALTVTEDYTRNFTRRLVGTVGIGVSGTRAQTGIGLRLPLYSIYPTARATLSDSERLARGKFTLFLGVTSAPALDPTTVTVDPRIGGYASVNWARDRFATVLGLTSQLSITPAKSNAFNAVLASWDAFYELGAGFVANAGVRGAWQELGGSDLVQPSLLGIVAINWSLVEPLTGRRTQQ